MDLPSIMQGKDLEVSFGDLFSFTDGSCVANEEDQKELKRRAQEVCLAVKTKAQELFAEVITMAKDRQEEFNKEKIRVAAKRQRSGGPDPVPIGGGPGAAADTPVADVAPAAPPPADAGDGRGRSRSPRGPAAAVAGAAASGSQAPAPAQTAAAEVIDTTQIQAKMVLQEAMKKAQATGAGGTAAGVAVGGAPSLG